MKILFYFFYSFIYSFVFLFLNWLKQVELLGKFADCRLNFECSTRSQKLSSLTGQNSRSENLSQFKLWSRVQKFWSCNETLSRRWDRIINHTAHGDWNSRLCYNNQFTKLLAVERKNKLYLTVEFFISSLIYMNLKLIKISCLSLHYTQTFHIPIFLPPPTFSRIFKISFRNTFLTDSINYFRKCQTILIFLSYQIRA